MDAQIGYTFQPGSRLNGLGLLLQVSNVLNSPYRTYYDVSGVQDAGDCREIRSIVAARRELSLLGPRKCMVLKTAAALAPRVILCALATSRCFVPDGAGDRGHAPQIPVAPADAAIEARARSIVAGHDARAEGRADDPGRNPLGHARRRPPILYRVDPQRRRRLAGDEHACRASTIGSSCRTTSTARRCRPTWRSRCRSSGAPTPSTATTMSTARRSSRTTSGLARRTIPTLMTRIGRATAEQVRATGITWAFAPTLAVVQNPRWGRTYESYSSDPAEVRAYGEAMVRGLQGELGSSTSVLATAKHYLGDGGTLHGVDQGETRTSEAEPLSHPRRRLLRRAQGQRADGDGELFELHRHCDRPAPGARCTATAILSATCSRSGLASTAWSSATGTASARSRAAPTGIARRRSTPGSTWSWSPTTGRSSSQRRSRTCSAGRIPMSRIDDAVDADHPTSSCAAACSTRRRRRARIPDPTVCHSPAVRDLAREAVRKSLVLLKNDGGALPLEARPDPGGRQGRRQPADADRRLVADLAGRQYQDVRLPERRHLACRRCASRSAMMRVDYSADGSGVDPSRYSGIVDGRGRKALCRDRRATSPSRPRCGTPPLSGRSCSARARERQRRAGGHHALFGAAGLRPTTSSTAPTPSSPPGFREPKDWARRHAARAARRRVALRLHRPAVVRLAGGRLPAAARRRPVPPRLRPVAVASPVQTRAAARIAAKRGLPRRKPVISAP